LEDRKRGGVLLIPPHPHLLQAIFNISKSPCCTN